MTQTDSDQKTLKEERNRKQRTLFIQVMLMFLVSIVVMVIGMYFFIIPRLLLHQQAISQLETRLADIQSSLSPEEGK